MQLELIPLDRAGAAAAAGLSEMQIVDWMTTHGLFPEKDRGAGARSPFMIWDVISLATIKALLDAGFKPSAAVEAIRPHSPYGALLVRDAEKNSTCASVFRLAQNHEGRWIGYDGPEVKVSLQVRMWPIFDQVFPRFCEQVAEYAETVPPEQLRQAIESYRLEMEELRAQRFSQRSTPSG